MGVQRGGYVYFMRPIGMEGPVKIGYSKEPRLRLQSYNYVSPWPLEIAAQVPAEPALEYAFHARFIAQHTHHEWFAASAELSETIRQVAAGAFDHGALPKSKRIIGNYHGCWTEPPRHPALKAA